MSFDASADLLISQWRSDAPVRMLVQTWLDLVEEELQTPLEALGTESTALTAVGVWLDYAATRVGAVRPLITRDSDVFGFDSAGTGFDQVRMRDVHGLEPLTALGDTDFRGIVLARGLALAADGSGVGMLESVRAIDPHGAVVDGSGLFEVVSGEGATLALANAQGALPRPAGIGYQSSAPSASTFVLVADGDVVLADGLQVLA